MTRALYRCLVWMHPPVFRREFAGEMLWIYDQAALANGVVPLFPSARLTRSLAAPSPSPPSAAACFRS